MNDKYIIYLAKQMRPDLVNDLGRLDMNLHRFLMTVEDYAEVMEGSVQSRQIVALAITMWDLFHGEDF